MAHEKSEHLPGDQGRAYLYETRRSGAGRPLACRVTELVPIAGGFLGLVPFAWSARLAESNAPATARKVAEMHATFRTAALAAVLERRQVIAAVAEAAGMVARV